VWSAPWAIIPLLLVVGFLVWRIRGWLDDREMRGLKVDKDAAETRLKLAEDKQKVFTAPVQILNSPPC
jgi:hypothetical protein